MKQEEWRPVLDYEGRYEVSDAGRVRSLLTIRGQTGRDLSMASLKHGYQGVGLCKNGTRRSALVHRLVLGAFVGRCPNGCEGSHLDGNPGNNSIGNLRWETKAENEQRKIRHRSTKHGELSPLAKLTNEDVLEMRRRRTAGEYYHDIAYAFGVARETARRAIVGIGGWGELDHE